jgi:hypothetical protein
MTIGTRLKLAGGCLLAALSVPALAQDTPLSIAQQFETVRAARVYADCVVGRFGDDAAGVIAAQLPNSETMQQHRRLLNRRCASQAGLGNVRFAFPGDTFKYVLSEGLVRATYAQSGPSSFAAVPALRWTPVVERSADEVASLRPEWRASYEANIARDRANLLLAILGECVARNEPVAVRESAFKTANIEEYRASLQPLIGALQTCLPEGETVRLRPDQLRGAALYAYARMAMQLPDNGGGQ